MADKKPVVFSVLMLCMGLALLAAYVYALTPGAIRNPRFEHAHIRMFLSLNGEAIDFGEEKYQRHIEAGCTDELSAEPIHFHDNKDQLVHLHWKGVSGGMVLKYYGWNLIGGRNDNLGHRADRLPLVNSGVPIYGDVLPPLPAHAKLWVYTGDANSFQLRNTRDFLTQDLETFLGHKSAIGAKEPDFWRNLFFTGASAHAVGDDGAAPYGDQTHHSQEELQRINNLLGDVVLFVQPQKPSDDYVRVAFKNLIPLGESSCAG